MTTQPYFRYVRRAPTGAAARFVRESAVVEAERCRTAVESALPDASAELYFNLGPAGRHLAASLHASTLSPRAAWVVGPRAQPLHIAKETRACEVVTVRLHPWAAERVLGVPAIQLRDAMVDLDVFWGRVVDDVRDRLHATRDPAERLAIVEGAVEQQAGRRAARVDVNPARRLCLASEADAGTSIGELGARFGYSHRRVIEIFDHAVGLKPKAHARVRRLRHVFRLIHEMPRRTWTEIAHRCGYFDQAHLINDFRRLTGILPTEYAATRSSIGRGFVPHRLA